MRARSTLVAAGAALMLVLSGCGSDGPGMPTGKDVKLPATNSATQDGADPSGKSEKPDNKPSEKKDDKSQAPSGEAAAFCAAMDGFDDLDDIEEGEKLSSEQQKRALAQIDRLIATAPKEIRGAVKTFMEPMRDIIKGGQLPAMDMEDVEKLPADMQQAFQKLFGYVMQNCVDFGDSTDSDS